MAGTRSKPSQGSVPADLTLASDFSFCLQHRVASSLVLRRPIETTIANREFIVGCICLILVELFYLQDTEYSERTPISPTFLCMVLGLHRKTL